MTRIIWFAFLVELGAPAELLQDNKGVLRGSYSTGGLERREVFAVFDGFVVYKLPKHRKLRTSVSGRHWLVREEESFHLDPMVLRMAWSRRARSPSLSDFYFRSCCVDLCGIRG
ncbi:hypothetical protein HD554DRAFT_2125025 [Boletus coccyginus]|nr:hypothetical protein HD554DRAFT_2125025 [Boletus coccyginus]